jgi:hypothetical protein
MKRRRPFELSLRILGALLDVILYLPAEAGETLYRGWRRRRRARLHAKRKRRGAIFAKYAALYGNHTPAFRAAVIDELLRAGYEPPARWRS